MIIDSHCHLDYPNLFNQLDEVVKRAELNQVKYLLTICTTLNSFNKIKLIIKKYNNIYGTFGIHPHETKDFLNIDCQFILNLKKKYKKVIGIGETGLDYYYNHSDKEVQKNSFVEHIRAASELNIPVIVHSRNAEIDTFSILKDFSSRNPKILMHCFTGSSDFSKKMLNLGAYISISGIITFNKSKELQETVSLIPIDRLLIETDSPFLAPIPKRGSANEPSFIKYTAMKLAEIKQISYDDLIVYTSNNFIKLFSLNQ